MLVNPPILLYNEPHHWLWMFRRLRRLASLLFAWILLNFFAGSMVVAGTTLVQRSSGMALLLLLGCLAVIYCGYLYLDWSSRTIHLYSDGRLEYEYGIFYRKGTSVSMRFGAVRYIYHDRMATWLDCVDLILPFDSGRIDAIAKFRQFWDIAQGRA